MNLMEFRLELEKLDMPIQYQSFSVGQAPELPYLIFYEDDSDNLFADNANYFNNLNLTCELYSDEKDLNLETKLQKLFFDNEIEYNSQETFIDSENMFMKAYSVSIVFDALADVQVKEADKSELQQQIDYVDSLSSTNYSIETWASLIIVKANAKKVLNDESIKQSEVYLVLIELFKAINNLKFAERVYEKGVNLYAPLYWLANNYFGDVNSEGVIDREDTYYVLSPKIYIPDSAYSLHLQLQSSNAIYVYLYDKNEKYIGMEFLYGDTLRKDIKKQAEYMYIKSNKQTASSLATAKIKLEYNEQTAYTIAPEDERFNILTQL